MYFSGDSEGDDTAGSADAVSPSLVGSDRTLHEVILAEKLDFEAKLERTERRKQWLKANQQLLRTLLSYRSVIVGQILM